MITAREVSYGLFGAWRLAHLDPRGMQYFDTTIEGFWRSFWAAAIAAPAFALMVALKLSVRTFEVDLLRFVMVEAIGYVILWTAFPLAAWYLLLALGRANRYPGYIVAYNWATVLQFVVTLPIAALIAANGLPTPITAFLRLAILAALLYYQYFVARTALEVDMPIAAGLVLTDLVLSVLRDSVVLVLELPSGVQPAAAFG